MPSVTYEIDREHRLVLIRMQGRVLSRDLLAVTGAMQDDPALDRGWGVLVDTREVTEAPHYTEMQNFVGISRRSPMSKESRRAFLVNSSVLFGVARMASTLASEFGRRYQVFRDEEDAYRWIAGGDEPAAYS